MDQQKTGDFLKHLRKGKGLTQEQLAEHFFVSTRTVSRWETGSNMPDVSMLIELADFYDVDLREIIDGERKSEHMENEMKETMQKVAEYAAKESQKRNERLRTFLACAVALGFVCRMLFGRDFVGRFYGIVPENICDHITAFTSGLAVAALAFYILHQLGALDKISLWKKSCIQNKH